MITRRSTLLGLIASPAIVRASSLMPVKVWKTVYDSTPRHMHECGSSFCNHPDHFKQKTLSEIYEDIQRAIRYNHIALVEYEVGYII